jgi:hypothetical protein
MLFQVPRSRKLLILSILRSGVICKNNETVFISREQGFERATSVVIIMMLKFMLCSAIIRLIVYHHLLREAFITSSSNIFGSIFSIMG